MIVDSADGDSLTFSRRYDVCIAGGGVAGIVLAKRLAEQRKRVLLLEAGGLELSEESQSLYRGANIGAAYFDLDATRLRYLGGTSNHWGGHCRPFDPIDFEARDAIPHSGWPIGISDVVPYLADACDILEVPLFGNDPLLEESQGQWREVPVHYSPPVRFGEKYHGFLAESEYVQVVLNGNLVDIELDPERGDVAAFVFRGYQDDAVRYRARADRYIVALGGIETPRMLLNANRQVQQGLGNETDLVGRFFMEHPHVDIGYYVTTKDMSFRRLAVGKGSPKFGLTAEALRDRGVGNARFVTLDPRTSDLPELLHAGKALAKGLICESDIIADFVRSITPLKCIPEVPPGAGLLFASSEQMPNPNSRVTLSDERDRFGLRRVNLNWELTPLDKKTLRVGALAFGEFVAQRDIARIKLFDWLLDDQDLSGFYANSGTILGGNHHMGTTRMGYSKQDGVVDRNGRVFGIENLYIAGSSVYRTSGQANPTLLIVQLALRLADHLVEAA